MKTSLIASAIALASLHVNAQQSLPSVFANYNNQYYNSVSAAASSIALPFLAQQGYITVPGVSVQDTCLQVAGVKYSTYEEYVNPNPQGNNGYYVYASMYPQYQIMQQAVWKNRMPNAVYNPVNKTFNATLDCVGYGTRVLAATGNSSRNGYSDLGAYARTSGQMHFAAPGYVASAYEIAIAFPVLGNSVQNGWQYIAGNVETSLVNSLNQANLNTAGSSYLGVAKGGFANAVTGDILAFGYAPGSNSNGHFMVFDGAPVSLSAKGLHDLFPAMPADSVSSLTSQFHIYAVPVLDCSGKYAHFNDSRKTRSGIGHGTIIVVSDLKNDIPCGFIFCPSPHFSGVEAIGSHVVAISVGRYTPAP